jgi:hypothetical protein
LVGGYTDGLFIFEAAPSMFAPFEHTTWLYPTAFNPGQYDLRAYTYGYFQETPSTAYAQIAQIADISITLIIGVNITLGILFKKESIFTPAGANMSARVRLFDDTGNLVGEWMSSEGTYVPLGSSLARASDGTTQYPFGPVTSGGGGRALQPSPIPLNTYNFLPGGVSYLQVLLAGLPQVPPFGQDSFFGTPKGGYTAYGTAPGWGGPYFGDPIFTHRTYPTNGGARQNACSFEVDCYPSPGPNWNAVAYFPNSGITGSPDYQGGWTAEVDFVNWYSANTGSTPNYYPPVAGLLMGESYHIIPGSPSRSGISLTEDAALNEAYLGHSMIDNHIGPYSQQGVWQIAGAALSGEASAVFEVNLNGLVSGNVFGFNSYGEFRTLSWDRVTVTSATGAESWNFSIYDGFYEGYLPPGRYQFAISAPGFLPQTWSSIVSPGMTQQGQNLYLEESNTPVPEFSEVAIVAFAALGASLYVFRRNRSRR